MLLNVFIPQEQGTCEGLSYDMGIDTNWYYNLGAFIADFSITQESETFPPIFWWPSRGTGFHVIGQIHSPGKGAASQN